MPKVAAYVYDITQGMAASMSMPLLGKQIDIIPHTGIVVFGKEYFFGGGPSIGVPGQSVPVKVAQVLELGETEKTSDELETYIRDVLSLEHTADNYNLLSHNCNHYADAVAKFLLGGKGLPSSIVNVAEEALSTPQGQSLRVMIENMERSMRASSGGTSSLNPFGSVGSELPATIPVAATPAVSDSNSELEAALSELASSNSEEVRRTALQMLVKMTENVEKSPGELKFRQIKMSNPAFTKKIGTTTGGVETMLAAGWLPDGTAEGEDIWQLNDEAAGKQSAIRKRLEAELAKLPVPKPVPAAAPIPTPAPSSGFGGGYGGLGTLGGLGGGNPMLQQMMQNPAMMQQAQQMMQGNPQMMAQAQQMMQDPNMMAQVQQMMQNPQAMAQMQQMMGGFGRGMGGF